MVGSTDMGLPFSLVSLAILVLLCSRCEEGKLSYRVDPGECRGRNGEGHDPTPQPAYRNRLKRETSRIRAFWLGVKLVGILPPDSLRHLTYSCKEKLCKQQLFK